MNTTFVKNFAVAVSTSLALVAAAPVMAQTTAAPAKPVAAPVSTKKAAVSASRTEIKSTAKNMAAGIEAAEDAMTPAELAIAERVYVGKLPCEFGATVTLTPDPKTPGYFVVQVKNLKYRMFPVATTTGAIRLEDRKAGAVWLQLANKSMLMNQKIGTRLADECASLEQVAVAEAIKLNPPVSVLDAPKPAASEPAAPAAVTTPAMPAMPASSTSAAK